MTTRPFWGDSVKDVHNFIDKNNISPHKVFVIHSDMNLNKTLEVPRKEYNLVGDVKCVYLDRIYLSKHECIF